MKGFPNLSTRSVKRKRKSAKRSWAARKEFAARNGLSFPNGGLGNLKGGKFDR